MGRNILFVTTDQQRYDALGCNGGTVARTPVADRLAAAGVRYERAHTQSVVCMPSRSTILTGQHPGTHGVWMNGVPLPDDAPSVAELLAGAGYRTGLFGKAHFEPFVDLELRFEQNRLAVDGRHGPHRGFQHVETAHHAAMGFTHYARWLVGEHPELVGGFVANLDADWEVNAAGGGDTGAVQVALNPVPRDRYHTDWVADRAIAWLDTLPGDAPWFAWVSFPDPHHPWDPPAEERRRVDWRDIELPERYLADRRAREALLARRPAQWLGYHQGELVANFEAPARFVPAAMTADQVREINAVVAVENELIDEAVGRILGHVEARGWDERTDVIVTTDHGELQGDYGLLFKGAYHVDALLRVPLIWRPAPAAAEAGAGAGAAAAEAEAEAEAEAGALAPVVVSDPVGLVDLAPTFCHIAGVDVPAWMEGRPLPASPAEAASQRRERALTVWDSEHNGIAMHLRTIYRDGWLCTAYEPGTVHDGTEGELYDCAADPLQMDNRWDDPACAALRADLVADLRDSLPPERAPRIPKAASV